MDQWIKKRLTECLGFPVPDEMITYILTLSDDHDIDEHFSSLLDYGNREHQLFLNDLKQRLIKKVIPPNGNGNKNLKKNPLAVKQTNKKVGSKESKENNQKPVTSSSQQQQQPAVDDTQKSNASTVKKKTKYFNLYTKDGEMRDVVLLKGRHLCNCQASKHKLINNCIRCGRIVCEQEGSGPCLFCGNLVCSDGEQRMIESATKKGETLKKSLMQQSRPNGWEEALALRNKLLEYDRTSEKRTTVIDDESDYFATNSVWLSDSERKKLQKLETDMNERKHASRLNRKITIDITGRQVIDEPQLAIDIEDEVLKEIAESYSINANIRNKIMNESDMNSDSIHPLFDFPPPMFDESILPKHFHKSHKPQESKYDGVFNRVQDKELLEISDLRNCLSMHQPWASLLVAGIKRHEGRSWYTAHRGRLWIAATAKPADSESIQQMEAFYRSHYKNENIEFPSQYPSGCLLGCVLVQDCLPQEEYRKQYPNGESDSPFVFICTEPQELPIHFPIKGMHKIYKIEPNIHTAAVKALQRMQKLKAEE